MKKVLSVFLSWIMVMSFCMSPVTALGAEEIPVSDTEATTESVSEGTKVKLSGEFESMEDIVFENPLFKDYEDSEDYDSSDSSDEEIVLEEEKTEALQVLSYKVTNMQVFADNGASVTAYNTVDEIAAYIRQQMIERENTITIYYYFPNLTEYNGSIVHQIMNSAMAHTGVGNEGDYLRWQFQEYVGHPSYNYGKKLLKIVYDVKYYTTKEQEDKVTASVNKILTNLNIYTKSDYQKVKAIYNYICANVTYDFVHLYDSSYLLKHTAYAATENKTAVCQGYALLFYRLALALNVDARVVVSKTHAWNIVKLSGKYYSLDSTWDSIYGSNSGDYVWFLKGTDGFYVDDDHTVDTTWNPTEIVNETNISVTDYVWNDINNFNITIEYTSVMYDGNAKTPTVTVEGLQKGKSFTVTYDNNIEVGRATAVVKGIGGYTGVYIKSFTITASELMRENQVYNLLKGDTNLRIYGLDRYETSLKTADALKSSLGVSVFENIIVADGRSYADALAGTYLAKVKDAPILVVGADEQSQSKVAAYIKSNLKASGTVYILGGTGAVSATFETTIKSVAKNVKRLAGDNRYATNIAILKESAVDSEEILVCSGLNFADSLSASAVGMPILLVGTELTSTQLAYLKSLDSNKYYIIGGTAAVSEKVQSQLSRWSTERIYGSNRYETSVEVAKAFFDNKTKSVVLAYGLNFPDGLSGGPLAMSLGAPLILSTTSNTSAAESYVTQIDLKGVVVLGGVSLISNAAVQSISN